MILKNMPFQVRLNHYLKLAETLSYIHSHEQQLVHNDIKPDNLMFDEGFHNLYLIDFGLTLK